MNIFHKFYASMKLREAIRKAEEAHSRFGQRFYVMPTFNGSGKLVIMDRSNFRRLKQKRYISDRAHVADLHAECFYCTSDRAGNCLSEEDRRHKVLQYFYWVEADRKARKTTKSKKE